MDMDSVYEQIRSNSKYSMMVARRRRLAGTLAGVVLVLFFAFILIAAFAPALLAQTLGDGSVTTIAIPLGVAMIVVFWLLTGLYMLRAKHDFDEMKDDILKEVTS
jgi:uncharacterized membrane protein (DUF485 family)